MPDFEELRTFEEKMYGDKWEKERYLDWMYQNLLAIKSVMSEQASIYVHLDWHIGHYVKILMDEIFGEANFMNEIVWHYYNKMQGNVNRFASNHDAIFVYKMSDSYCFQPIKEKREEKTKQIKRVWDKTTQRLVNAKDENGKVIYIETDEKTIDDVWRMSMLQPADTKEPVDYSTQKPEALLERVINASSNEGMLVADFFSGSGTTAAVAHKLNRRFIAGDIGINSIETTRDRLKNLGANFDVVDIKDGVTLYRNPVQTKENITKQEQADERDYPEDLTLTGDKEHLLQIVSNLVTNAVKYTEKGGVTLRVQTVPQEDGKRYSLTVRTEDTGIGIPDEALSHIFELFYRFLLLQQISSYLLQFLQYLHLLLFLLHLVLNFQLF